MKRIAVAILSLVLLSFAFSSCADDADVVNENITKASKNFEVYRRVVLVNGITDKYILSVEGLCDIEPKTGRVFVTCKTSDGSGSDSYIRHQFYRSDNTFVFVEQLRDIKVSAYYYRMTFKPQVIVPDIDARGEAELPQNQ